MKVAFVTMPFAGLRPSIGVSLLKAHLEASGFESRIFYLNMRFAALGDTATYDYVAEEAPTQSLAGDWIFAPALFGPRANADAAYIEAFAKRFPRSTSLHPDAVAPPVPTDILWAWRERVDRFLASCMSDVEWDRYDLVGFTSMFTQHVASLALARRLKDRFPRVKIAFGGANCEADMGLQLHRSFPFIDFVCSAEADLTFPQLVNCLARGEEVTQIPGLIYRAEGESRATSLSPRRVRDLYSLPIPDYDDYFDQLAEAPADHDAVAAGGRSW